MGTNYYWRNETNHCDHCGRCDSEEIHIGKSSVGWTFSFYGTNEIRSWKDWQVKIKSAGRIFNEYGHQISFGTLLKIVEVRFHSRGLKNHTDYCRANYPGIATEQQWKDEEGHSFSPHYFS